MGLDVVAMVASSQLATNVVVGLVELTK